MEENMRVMISFWITGDRMDFERVTQTVGLQPAQICSKEDCKNPMFACARWHYDTGYLLTDSVADELEKLVDRLWERGSDIEQLLRENQLECGFGIVLQTEEDQSPAIELSRRFIQFAAMIDAEISLDIY